MDQYWLSIIIIVLIVVILFDGIRRMRKAKKDSIKMSLRPVERDLVDEDEYGSEFPNGGARVSNQKIDPDRISKARSKYNFGSDIPAWREKVANTIAEHTGLGKKEDEADIQQNQRIEPSVEADPLLDDISETSNDALPESEASDLYNAQEFQEPLSEQGIDEEPTSQQTAHQDETSEHRLADEDIEWQDSVSERDANADKVEESLVREPVQTSLNLEDAVPMLMDSLDESEDETASTTTPRKGSDGGEQKTSQSIRPVGVNLESEKSEVETHSANKPRYESKYVDHKEQAEVKASVPTDVLVIQVRAPKNEYFFGADLLELVLENGLRFGAMDIFHCHADEDGEGPILFSMANMVKPGTFDLHTFEEFSTVGLSFFLTLPTETGKNMEAFDAMLKVAQNIAEKLLGELYDEQRSVLTGQTIEHYRERIRDFARRQQLEKNKT
jgi:cell division protein ZipA